MYTMPIQDYLTIRDESVEVPVPTLEVKVVGKALETFIVCRTHLIKAILKTNQVYLINFC